MHDDRLLALRVAARHQRTVLAIHWDGKLVGKDFRLQWSRDQWQLEELPQKGKKKLRVDTMDGGGNRYSGHGTDMSAYIAQNILRRAGVSPADSFDHVKAKIQAAMDAAAEEVIAKARAAQAAAATNEPGKHEKWDWEFLRHTKWHENLVYFTEVMPEGMEPITVEGADFAVKAEWTDFSTYSPDSDLQNHDPSYTKIVASSPGAARKFYQIMKENPQAIKHIAWNKFTDWLAQNKIGYKMHFSQWH
jgi:hypothetical protein